MDRIKTTITSSFLGLVKRGSCPVCGTTVAVNLGCTTLMLCPNCGDYLEVIEKMLCQMDPTLIKPAPAFAVPMPWTDYQIQFRQLNPWKWRDYLL
jgi:hypothetical protein